MGEINKALDKLIEEFKVIDGVSAMAFAGSNTSNRGDSLSDIDIDIFTSKDISVEKRNEIISKYSTKKEVGKDHWGQCDEFLLNGFNKIIDLAYFDINWIEDILENILINHKAQIGYSTCFWHNVKNLDIIFDKDGKLTELKEKTNIDYPKELKENIISDNMKILKGDFSSYYVQIEKAIKREDINSINHRLSGFMASYFDILFAVNEIPNPGEKRLISIIKDKAKLIPNNFEEDINKAFKLGGECNFELLEILDRLIKNLKAII